MKLMTFHRNACPLCRKGLHHSKRAHDGAIEVTRTTRVILTVAGMAVAS